MKKRYIILLALACLTGIIYAETSGRDGGQLPTQGVIIGVQGSDGKYYNVRGTTSGALNIASVSGAAAGATLVSSTAYETSHVLKNAAGTLISIAGYNSKASAQFIQLYNSATVPADTAVPVFTITVPATSNFSFDVPITGVPFTTGIAVSNSSTGPTKTIGSADCYFTAVVK